MSDKTRDPVNQICVDYRDNHGVDRLGLMSGQVWRDDPKRLLFVLSRYKFVAKMLNGAASVLEVGCGDAFGTRIVAQAVSKLTAVDAEPIFIQDTLERMDERWLFDCRIHDILEAPVEGEFDGVYALDVLEHIAPEHENRFLANMVASLTDNGALVLGTPSIESQAHASRPSKEGHINCKDAEGLKELLARYFATMFIFSMNDEVVHTGFYPMANYLLALCCNKRRDVRPTKSSNGPQ